MLQWDQEGDLVLWIELPLKHVRNGNRKLFNFFFQNTTNNLAYQWRKVRYKLSTKTKIKITTLEHHTLWIYLGGEVVKLLACLFFGF